MFFHPMHGSPSSDRSDAEESAETTQSVPAWMLQVGRLASAVAEAARRDPALRVEILGVLRLIETAVNPGEPEAVSEPIAAPPPEVKPAPVPEAAPEPAADLSHSTVAELATAMRAKAWEKTGETGGGELPRTTALPTIESIARACRVKVEACHWAGERRRLLADGADFRTQILPRDQVMIAKGREAENCYLWMCTSSAPVPSRPEAYLDLAACYGNAAAAADMLAQCEGPAEDLLEPAMLLAAEAQSALRVAVGWVGTFCEDQSQNDLFLWLRETATQSHIYIPRFLRKTDAADPLECEDLAHRIGELQKRVIERAHTTKQIKKALGVVRHHARLLGPERDNLYDWKRIFESIQSLVPELMAPSDSRLRELLAGHLDHLPEELDVSKPVEDVLDSVENFVARRLEAEGSGAQEVAHSAEVAAVRAHLEGQTLIVVGGDPRPFAKEALCKAFGLAEVDWLSSREHQSTESFRAPINAPNVGLLLLAIRWSSHCFGVVRDYCEAANVPFVRLPGGYNPNQVAHQILEQHPDWKA